MNYCAYYQAKVKESDVWFLVAVLRSFEHLTFDRTLEKENSIFEFFVPSDNEQHFLQIMHYFQKQLIIEHLVKHENRLLTPGQQV